MPLTSETRSGTRLADGQYRATDLLTLQSPDGHRLVATPTDLASKDSSSMSLTSKMLGEVAASTTPFELYVDLSQLGAAGDALVGTVASVYIKRPETVFFGLSEQARQKLSIARLIDQINISPAVFSVSAEDLNGIALSSGLISKLQEGLAARYDQELRDRQLAIQRFSTLTKGPEIESPALASQLETGPKGVLALVVACNQSQFADDSADQRSFSVELEGLAQRAVAASNNMIIDLSGVGHLGSQAVGSIVKAYGRLKSSGLVLAICGAKANSQAFRTLNEKHLFNPGFELMSFHEKQEDALASLDAMMVP